ncbi:DUF1801 domain-containing protein [Candidatus Saccharibacteria bacterium]|nr:DUF1801 domain-containing protein [Candidatus Saccharibacteria bacterium]
MDTSDKVTEHINSYSDWRSERLKELRELIGKTSPDLIEDFKWGVPVWTHYGLVCAISGFKDYIKINFFKGAFLPDPASLFNSGLDSKEHRSINLQQLDTINSAAISDLIRAAVAYNS